MERDFFKWQVNLTGLVANRLKTKTDSVTYGTFANSVRALAVSWIIGMPFLA